MSWRRFNSSAIFRDRRDAGRQLAAHFAQDPPTGDVVVLGLPRGGVPVAYEIAVELKAPLDVLVVRKLGAPFNPELAIGAIGPRGVVVLNDHVIDMLHVEEDALDSIRAREQAVLEERERNYRRAAEPIDVEGKTAIVVDDGIATGATMIAAVKALKQLKPKRIIVAIPTSSTDAYTQLKRLGVEVVALSTPDPYIAVGAWYQHFEQTSDQDVIELLARETTAGSTVS
jgi:predicted phosphoribosyltransferase